MTTNWKEYSGSDEQIADIGKSVYANGFITRNGSGIESSVVCSDTTHYWIIPADPLRDMKIRQAETGQPVWIKLSRDDYFDNTYFEKSGDIAHLKKDWFEIVTTKPDWNIAKAKYGFKPFED